MEQFNDPIDQYIQKAVSEKGPRFRALLEEFRIEKEGGNYHRIATNAGITYKTLKEIITWQDGTYNRDILWGLSIELGLNMEETERLFNSCGMTTKYCRHLESSRSNKQANSFERERAIEFGILNGWDLDTINEELEKRGFEGLGSV